MIYNKKTNRKGKEIKNKYFSFFLFYIILSIITMNTFLFLGSDTVLPISAQELSKTFAEVSVPSGFKEPTVTAHYAILMDSKTGQILYKKNANDKAFPASITKIMTGLLAIENLKDDDIITMTHDAVYSVERGSSHIALQVGEQFPVSQALYALLMVSANDAANGIAEKVSGDLESFAKLMTKKAIELGAMNTNFVNAHGLPDDMHYTTAYDMAIITRHAISFPRFNEYFSKIQYTMPPTNLQPQARNFFTHHKMLYNNRYQYKFAFAGKTGYTSKAGSTLITIAKKDNHELICVTMKESAGEAYADAKVLFNYGFSQFEPVDIDESLYKEIKINAVKNNNIIGVAKLISSESKALWVPKNSQINKSMVSIEAPLSVQNETKDDIIIKANVSKLSTSFYEASIDMPLKSMIILNNVSTESSSVDNNLGKVKNKNSFLLLLTIGKYLLFIIIGLLILYLLYVMIMIFYTGFHKKLFKRLLKKLKKRRYKIHEKRHSLSKNNKTHKNNSKNNINNKNELGNLNKNNKHSKHNNYEEHNSNKYINEIHKIRKTYIEIAKTENDD